MTDRFSNFQTGLTSPATEHFLIVPDDGTDLPEKPRTIYCETDGTLVVRDAAQNDLSYTMFTGDRLEFRGVRVLATGTTGTFYGWV